VADAIELVIGLGNPGQRYAGTRHNVGFAVLEELRRRCAAGDWERRPDCEMAVIMEQRAVVLARPQSFMNRSGSVTAALLEELGLEPSTLLVVVDDADLPLGILRMRPGGGPGTHNGLRDICDHIGCGFPRLRVGVRGAGPVGDLAEYVLSRFEPDEIESARSMVLRACDAAELAIRDGIERAMNRYNGAAEPDASE
jgi:peptidyl-tRNA hydrolase, PTH1 family